MPKDNVHITKREDDKWQAKVVGNSRASSVHDTQADAIKAGREIAKRNKSENVIHGRDGKIRDKDSYGSDPHPPKDRKH